MGGWWQGGIVSRDSERVSKEAGFGLPLDKISGCPSCYPVTADQPHALSFLLKPFWRAPFLLHHSLNPEPLSASPKGYKLSLLFGMSLLPVVVLAPALQAL